MAFPMKSSSAIPKPIGPFWDSVTKSWLMFLEAWNTSSFTNPGEGGQILIAFGDHLPGKLASSWESNLWRDRGGGGWRGQDGAWAWREEEQLQQEVGGNCQEYANHTLLLLNTFA